MISKWLCPFTALAATVLIGFAHGSLVDRWGVPGNVDEAALRLDQVPQAFGEWVSNPGPQLKERTKIRAGAAGYLSRVYQNERTGALVNVMILCGRPGPVSSHDPAVCFTQAGMRQLTPEEKRTLEVGPESRVEFLAALFRPPETSPGPDLESFWALSPDGQQWTAISDGRVKFAREPFLFRTYMTAADSGSGTATSVVEGFLTDFLPVLSSALKPSASERK